MKYPDTPPDDSPSVQKLLQAANKANVDSDVLREILWLTTTHNHLLSFSTAAERLRTILEGIPETWGPAEAKADIQRWSVVLNWVVREKVALAKEIGEHFARSVNTTSRNPMRGSGSTEFPFYAMLCEPTPKGQAGDQFILLSAHLLFAYVIAIRENSTISDYETYGPARQWKFLPNQVDTAARAVRRLAEPRGHELLIRLPLNRLPETFAEDLQEEDIPSDPDLQRDHPGLYRFLQKAWGIIDWNERDGGGGGGSGGGHRWVGGRLESSRLIIEPDRSGYDTDPAISVGAIDIVTFKTPSTHKQNVRLKSDLCPDEDDEDEEVLLSDFDCEITKKDPGAQARNGRSKARHVSKHNQMLSWAYDRLATEEVQRLVNKLFAERDALLGSPSWSEGQRTLAEVVLGLLISLALGRDFETITDICLHDALREAEDVAIALLFVGPRPLQNTQWRIKTLRPDYKTDLASTPEQIRPQVDAFELPELLGIAPLVERLLNPKQRVLHRRAIFGLHPKFLATEADNWLRSNFPDGRVTRTKIESVLWNSVLDRTGDVAIASCTTGLRHRLASVRLYYTAPWVADLQRHYVTAMRLLAPPIGTLATASTTAFPLPQKPVATAGARMCPTVTAVRTLFQKLTHDIERASDYYDRAGFARYHNLLTLYSVQFFAYATTCRAIVTPYLPVGDIAPERGIASLSDKDDEWKHKTRLVWIPPDLYRHMEAQELHLQALKAQLSDLPTALRKEPVLFLNPPFKAALVRPKTLEPLLANYLNVRANTHRRFLRTELLERGCSPEIIDAFLGHWQDGEEPFGTFSSFSFDAYVAELHCYLEPLLSDIGLTRPLIGRLAR